MPRDPAHFDHLLRLLTLERKQARAQAEERARTLTLAEREARGQVLLELEAVEEAGGLGGRYLVELEKHDRSPLPSRPSPGELVALWPKRPPEGAQPASAVVVRASARRVQVAFDRSPPPFVFDGRLRLELLPNDVTFDRAEQAVRETAALDRGQARHLRELLLGNAPARFGPLAPPRPSRPLNPEQADAVARALAAEDFFLVHGPPGTGKSTVLAEVATQAVGQGARLLATAASNAAVDHLLELCLASGLAALRVGHPARVSERLQRHTLDVQVEEHPDRRLAREFFEEAFDLLGYARRQRRQGRRRERFANAREAQAEARRLMDDARVLERKAVAAVLGRARVVCATLSMLQGHVLAHSRFDLCLLDEATQAIEPLALGAFLKADRVVLAGDHRQLPPTVLSPDAAREGLSVSLFERLLSDHGEPVKGMLAEQYRMNEAIMTFPSRELYEGRLRAHPAVAHRLLGALLSAPLDAPPLLFLDTAGKGFDEEREAGTESLRNPGEAALVVARARELLDAGLPPRELAVIAPYSAQAALLRERLSHPEVEVDTVDAFQGREKEAVLVSLTRSNAGGQLGFLSDLRRMNVALTRARRHLFVVGDFATLASHPFYVRFQEEAQRQGGYRSAWEWPQPA